MRRFYKALECRSLPELWHNSELHVTNAVNVANLFKTAERRATVKNHIHDTLPSLRTTNEILSAQEVRRSHLHLLQPFHSNTPPICTTCTLFISVEAPNPLTVVGISPSPVNDPGISRVQKWIYGSQQRTTIPTVPSVRSSTPYATHTSTSVRQPS